MADPCSPASRISCPIRLRPWAHTPLLSFWEKSDVSLRTSQPPSVQSFVWVPSSCCPSCFPSACCCARLSHGVSTTLLHTFYVVFTRELLWSMIFGLLPSRVFHFTGFCLCPASNETVSRSKGSLRRWKSQLYHVPPPQNSHSLGPGHPAYSTGDTAEHCFSNRQVKSLWPYFQFFPH